MFTDKSCVIESEVQPKNMGFITNGTKHCSNFFGISKSQIIGKNIDELFPFFLMAPHK
jgi:hypothetical protein